MKKNKDLSVLRFTSVGLAAVVLTLSASTTLAATLNVLNGQLMGADGVNVNGSLYNVDFLDGSCISLYNCGGFTFNTLTSATAASQALLDQVFLDGPLGQFDSKPTLTNGIEIDGLFGRVDTVFNRQGGTTAFGYASVLNYKLDANDTTSFNVGHDWLVDSGENGLVTHAVWEVAVNPVPIPAAVWLFGSGLIGLIGLARSKKA